LKVFEGHRGNVRCVSFCQGLDGDARFIVSGSFDNAVMLWDTLAGHEEDERHALQAHSHYVVEVKALFFPTNKQEQQKKRLIVVSASSDFTIRAWDVSIEQL